jgi:hypothetical protein
MVSGRSLTVLLDGKQTLYIYIYIYRLIEQKAVRIVISMAFKIITWVYCTT